jgi:hypothetical protein
MDINKILIYKFMWILSGGDYDKKLGNTCTYSLIEINSKYELFVSKVNKSIISGMDINDLNEYDNININEQLSQGISFLLILEDGCYGVCCWNTLIEPKLINKNNSLNIIIKKINTYDDDNLISKRLLDLLTTNCLLI